MCLVKGRRITCPKRHQPLYQESLSGIRDILVVPRRCRVLTVELIIHFDNTDSIQRPGDFLMAPALFGIAGLALMTVWSLFASRRHALISQVAGSLCWGCHYGLLGAWSAAGMAMLSAVQSASAIPGRSRTTMIVFGLATLGIGIVAVVTWAGVISGLAALGLGLQTLSRWQRLRRPMLLLAFGAGSCWLAHDILIGSPLAILADVVAMGMRVWGMRRAETGLT